MKKKIATVFTLALLVGLNAYATSIIPPRLEQISLSLEDAVKLGFIIEREFHEPISTIIIKAPEFIDGNKYSFLLIYLYSKKEMLTHYTVEGLNLEPRKPVPLRSSVSMLTHQLSISRKFVSNVHVVVSYEKYQYSFSVPANGL